MWSTALRYVLVGALFWIVGTFFHANSQRFIDRSVPADLIVLHIDSQIDTDGDTTFRPVFGLKTDARPRPEYAGNMWMSPAPHQPGETVPGRYDANTGEMRSDHMNRRTRWIARIMRILGILAGVQGIMMMIGLPEALLPLRVRLGSKRTRRII